MTFLVCLTIFTILGFLQSAYRLYRKRAKRLKVTSPQPEITMLPPSTANDRVWGEYDKYGYRVYSFRQADVPAGYEEEHGEAGEIEIYRAGNSPYESTTILRGQYLENALPLKTIHQYCLRTTRDYADSEGLPYHGVFEVSEDELDEEDEY
jgi:hypothetical protein